MTTKEYIESFSSWEIAKDNFEESLSKVGYTFENHIPKSNEELNLLEKRKNNNLLLTEDNKEKIVDINTNSTLGISFFNVERELSQNLITGYERINKTREDEYSFHLAEARVNEKVVVANKVIEDLRIKIDYTKEHSLIDDKSYEETYTRFLKTIDNIADKVMLHPLLDSHKERLKAHLESMDGVRFNMAIKSLREEYDNLLLEFPILKSDMISSIRSSTKLPDQIAKVKRNKSEISSLEKEIKNIEEENTSNLKSLSSYMVKTNETTYEFSWMTEEDYEEAIKRNESATEISKHEKAVLDKVIYVNNLKTYSEENSGLVSDVISKIDDDVKEEVEKKSEDLDWSNIIEDEIDNKIEDVKVNHAEMVGGFRYPNLIEIEEDPAMKKWYKYLQDLYVNQGKGFKIDKNNITNFKIVFKNPMTNLTTVKESVVQLNHSFSCKSTPIFAIGRKTYQAFSEGVRLLAGTLVVNAFDNVPLAHLHSISYSENAYVEDLPPIDLYIIPIEPLADGRFETLKISGMKFLETKQTDGASSNGRYYAFDFVAENFEPMDFQDF